jgi:putative addiction module component (TIGR02574 family)
MNSQFPELFEMSVPERLQLVESLWDSIAQTPESLPLPEWQVGELARRKAAHLANPGVAPTWEEAIGRLRMMNAR